ncbi:MAG: LysR family transcriptional regulator [Verrucomicrobiaceae bacterium]|nr:LysR family transcriptional regulator [Verrucomicrobiaceae bacterium]
MGPPAIDSRRLQAFVFAAEAQSFAAAAQSLSLVPSAVSHAIRSLEEDLRCVLFKRQGPKVSLTRAGLRLMPFARTILSQMDEMRQEITLIDAQKDCLRVIVPDAVCARLLPTVLPDLQESFPGANIEIIVSHDPMVCAESLRNSRADIVISTPAPVMEEFVRRDLFQESASFYTAPFHAFAKSNALTREELRSATVMTADAGVHEFLAGQFFLNQFIPGRLWQLHSHESVCELACAGWGIAVIPEWVARPLITAQRLAALSIRGPRLERSWSAYWLGNTQPSWTAEVFLSLMEMALQATD